MSPGCAPIEAGLEPFHVHVSPDGTARTGSARGLAGAAYGDGRFVVAAAGDVEGRELQWLVSDDGEHFETHQQALAGGEIGEVASVYYGLGRFLMFVNHRPSWQMQAYVSEDGTRFDALSLPSEVEHVLSLAAGDGELRIAAGPAHVWVTSDLEHWQQEVPEPVDVHNGTSDIAFGEGRWLAASVRSQVIDGRHHGTAHLHSLGPTGDWVAIDVPDEGEGFRIESAGGHWLALARDGSGFRSDDGLHFEPLADAFTDPVVALNRIGERFMVTTVPAVPWPERIRLLSSDDGAHFEDACELPGRTPVDGKLGARYHLPAVVGTRERYLLAGNYGLEIGALDPPWPVSDWGPILATGSLP